MDASEAEENRFMYTEIYIYKTIKLLQLLKLLVLTLSLKRKLELLQAEDNKISLQDMSKGT